MKKRLFAAVIAVLLLALAACGIFPSGAGEETEPSSTGQTTPDTTMTTTAEPSTAPRETVTLKPEPADKKAPMLYPIYAKDGTVGLIDQNARVVAAPRFDSTQYILDVDSKARGVLAKLGREHWYFALDGTEKKLKLEADTLEPLPDCKTVIVHTIDPQNPYGMEDLAEWATPELIKYYEDNWEKTRDGLFDLSKNRYIIEPKDGRMINPNGSDRVYATLYNRIDWRNDKAKLISSDEYDLASGKIIKKNKKAERFEGYLPAPQWYYGYEEDNNMYTVYYDKDFLKLDIYFGSIIDFKYGNYGIAYMEDESDAEEDLDIYTLIDKTGNLSDIRTRRIERVGNCFVCWDGYWSSNGYSADYLLDSDANVVWSRKNGECLIPLEPYKRPGEVAGFKHYRYDNNGTDWEISVVFDRNDKVIKVFDSDGNLLQAGEHPSVWVQGYGEQSILLGKNNKWTWVDFSKFVDYPVSNENRHNIFIDMATDDFVHLTRYIGGSFLVYVEDFFLDYNGKKLKETPLSPFAKDARNSWMQYWTSTGYKWIETDTKTGYIDTQGNWFYVMPE